tara:strand:- start:556 stop:786 length:231 start_codon:yes stop_codon:yes gene_type:complete
MKNNWKKKALQARWLMFICFVLFVPSLLYAILIEDGYRIDVLDTLTVIFIIFGFGGFISGAIMHLVYSGRALKEKK